ncbi:hypothetical protein [uncultured Phascolarctobacterium sp.]|uniref:hypothetical protein n=1 Tax=uncultured Phascolarctobacterium sp. TaxID=512296 RepID=UPI0027D96633|nr:hypothetical protein [uncultured Phascolarctobacterium sp.]
MAKEKTVKKFSKKQIITSQKYKDFYVLRELLKDNEQYTLDDVENILKRFKKEVTR